MTWRPDIIVYHFPCDDGMGSALAAYELYGSDIEFYPINYGEKLDMVRLGGKRVLMADISFPVNVMEQAARIANSLVVLDHHKTAEEALGHFPSFDTKGPHRAGFNVDDVHKFLIAHDGHPVVHFNMKRSGAALTWLFLNPQAQHLPLLIELVEDRDLWHFHNPMTKPIGLYLRSLPFNLDQWSLLLHRLEVPELRAGILAEGQAIERFFDRKVREVADQFIWQNVGGFKVPVANANWVFSSDVGHQLLKDHPTAPFAATYFDDGQYFRKWSLRSLDDREDASAVAKKFGGGGHRNAAGFTTVPNKWPM